jgi:glyoxylase-like metal-dependent hydrolase (beta-lactamase superfamily II)
MSVLSPQAAVLGQEEEEGEAAEIPAEERPAEPTSRTVKVSKACYLNVRSGGRSNAGFIVGGDSVMVIDCFDSPAEGKRLLAEVARVTDKPVRHVVLTHGHYDHSIGNQAMPREASILASGNAADWLAKRLSMDRMVLQQGPGGVHGSLKFRHVRAANEKIEKQREVDLGGGVKVHLFVIGDCHAAGDLVVYVPSEKVLYAGDLVWNGYHPNLSGGATFLWLTRLAVLEKLDVTKVLPGHGAPGDKSLLKAQLRYLMDLRSLVKHLLKRGVEPATIVRKLEVPKQYRSLGYAEYWPANVKFVTGELIRKR